jgi:hypothetical protein
MAEKNNPIRYNPDLWKQIYDDCQVISNPEHFRAEHTKLELVDAPPELAELSDKTATFWEKYSQSPMGRNDHNGKKYAFDDMKKVGNTLVVRAFETDYATMMMKRLGQNNLTPEERDSLKYLMVIGVGGYVMDGDDYLLGMIKGKGQTSDLWENIPQGFLESGAHEQSNPFLRTLRKEFEEETLTDPNDVITETALTHISSGKLYGALTLIYGTQATPSLRQLIPLVTDEHRRFSWANVEDVLDPHKKSMMHPATVKLFRALSKE